MTSLAEMQPHKSSYLPLVILVLLFALPPVMGWFFFLNPQLLPERQNNNGSLITPQASAHQLVLTTADGKHFDWQKAQGRWLLVSLARGECTQSCQEKVEQLQQIRLAVGANRQRVKSLLILLRKKSGDNPDAGRLGDTQILYSEDAPAVSRFFALDENGEINSSFVIDPRGTLMMKHDKGLESKAVLRDLEHLLKASQSWVKGAQYGHK